MVLIRSFPDRRSDILSTVLDSAETGIAVFEGEGQALYLNASARKHLGFDQDEAVPDWLRQQLAPLLDRLWRSGVHAVERWVRGDVVLRVRARPIDVARAVASLEITVVRAGQSGQLVEPLAQSLGLSMPDARLLAFLWRGMSNEDIAQTLNVRLGTVKSRVFRLYQKLGVKKRPEAVLLAAEILKNGQS